jgi:hypothetical protein
MTQLENLLAEHEIIKTVTGYMMAVDTGKWDDVGAFFAPEVFLDYTSVRPLPPARSLQREAMVSGWQTRYAKEIAYQHGLSNLVAQVQGLEATCAGNNVASHVMDDPKGHGIVLWQIGVRLNWRLRNESSNWLITSVVAEYVWDRTEPFEGMRIPRKGGLTGPAEPIARS